MHVSAAVNIPFLNMSVRPAPESSLFGKGGVALKPPLYARHRCPTDENDIYFSNETMDLLTENQEGSLDQQKSHKAELEYDDDDDFMMRFVDGTCRGIFPADNDEDIEKRSLCQLPSCHLGERLDVLLHCRQPLSFFSFFHEIQSDEGVEVVHLLPAGAYLLPRQCEYCGQSDTKLCNPKTCTRPSLYLQKKRPPFGKANSSQWDPITDHAISIPSPPPHVVSPSRSPGSWVSDFFRGGGSVEGHRQ